MSILIVPDSFKESCTALEVIQAIKKGIRKVNANVTINALPFSDGGEGALDLLALVHKGEDVYVATEDALGRPITVPYYWIPSEKTAWVELAQASGIVHVEEHLRNPKITSTYGTGILLLDALKKGAKKIILGIGGSATNDAAAGIFQALGGRLYDSNGNELAKGGAALAQLYKIDWGKAEQWKSVEWQVACDVDNPLLGPGGASHTYGPQKGADSNTTNVLEEALAHFASCIEKQCKKSIAKLPGGGAAGGTAAGMSAFFDAKLKKGFSLLAELTSLEDIIKSASLIFTAEGRLDSQSLQGKVPVEIAKIAKKHKVPVICLTGSSKGPYTPFFEAGIDGVFPIQNGPMDIKKSKENALNLIEDTTERVYHFYKNTAE